MVVLEWVLRPGGSIVAFEPGLEPQPGEQWRVSFSRVAWQVDAREGRYTKRLDPATGKSLPADNWVWSPQGGQGPLIR